MKYPMLATVKYEFNTATWVATLDAKPEVSGEGHTQEEALENLRYSANKHDLWPKD